MRSMRAVPCIPVVTAMHKDRMMNWLLEQMNDADDKRHNSNALAPNSFGAGYDQGFYEGLREALGKLTEDEAAITSGKRTE